MDTWASTAEVERKRKAEEKQRLAQAGKLAGKLAMEEKKEANKLGKEQEKQHKLEGKKQKDDERLCYGLCSF